jgi:PAS domain S-box-containing protein
MDKESKRVLIVDDDTLLRGLCGLALRPAGYDLREAECGEDAVASFAVVRTDLVILDVQMDGIDGYETCRRIRRLPGGDTVPIIMLTGMDDADSIERAYEAGATDFIPKPFQWSLLAQRVRYALRAAGTAEVSRQVAFSLARAQELAHLGSWSMTTEGSMQCSEQLLHILGLSAHSGRLSQDDLLSLVVDADRARMDGLRQALAQKGEGYQEVYAVRRADGVLRTVYERALMLNDARGVPLRMEGITQDITDRVDAERRIAEWAMHVAKRDANGSILFYDASISTNAGSQLAAETDLRRALSGADEMLMYLQPKVDIRTGMVCGAEALIRWQHPVHGLISPAEFIPVAEKTGLVGQITEWMLEQACRQMASWRRSGLESVPVSVNISAMWFTHRSLVEHIDTLLRRYHLEPGMLMLEVTESILVRDMDKCIERMRDFRQRGIGVSLDDFGTGYSSLSYLKKMPLDELKLDRSFVTDIGASGRDQALAASVVQLAQRLELSVVAEGVETEAQAAVLAEMGCHIHQGYLYGKPAPAAAFAQYLMAAESIATARRA